MFIINFFGVMDLLIATVILIAPFIDLPFRFLLVSALFLMLKKFMFKGDLLSTIDFGVGCYALIAILFPILFFSILSGSYLFLKGFYSMVA
ncbi:hypothetical protein JXA48_01190 [Candidatus Woesearchaeota archaeon]|nr:hypothetical protein [Candidatus Woesearchaeota archaeon]